MSKICCLLQIISLLVILTQVECRLFENEQCDEVLPALEAVIENEMVLVFNSSHCSCVESGLHGFEASCTAIGEPTVNDVVVTIDTIGDHHDAKTLLCATFLGSTRLCASYPFLRRFGNYRDASSCIATINSEICDECTVIDGSFPVPPNSTRECSNLDSSSRIPGMDSLFKSIGF